MEFQLYTIQSKGVFVKSYEIHDQDKLRFSAKAKSFFRGITIFDLKGTELLVVKKMPGLFKSSIKIVDGIKDVAIIKKPLFSGAFQIVTKDGDYTANSNLLKTEFTFTQAEEEVAKISRIKNFLNQRYGLAVKEDHDPLLFIALTLALDFWIRRRKAKS